MLAEPAEPLEPHPNCDVIATGKGGVGKTTIASHLAGASSKNGVKTLMVCLTSQEEDDFGIHDHDRGIHPEGESVLYGAGLYRALRDGTPLEPVQDVRPNLDVVPGGVTVGQLVPLFTARLAGEGAGVALALARSLAPISHRYGHIVIDSAPENDALEQLALAAARRMFVPTRSDKSSINGIRRIARNFKLVKTQVNPWVEVAGACLYGSNPSATSVHAGVYKKVEAILGDNVAMLRTVVGYREAPAIKARELGLLFWEYANKLTSSARSYDVAAGRAQWADVVPDAIVPLAHDMNKLIEEFNHRKESM